MRGTGKVSGETEISRFRLRTAVILIGFIILPVGTWIGFHPFRGAGDLLVVGYDSSLEYITEVSQVYSRMGIPATGNVQSLHAGSVRQAENIMRGLSADIVFLASQAEMDSIQLRTGCLDAGWETTFPNGSSPVYSTIVLIVREGNPHGINDWIDLHSKRVRVAMPDPRWSGAGRYAYLALMADALKRHNNDVRSANEEVRSLLMRVKLIPLGTHSAINLFARSPREDVFLTWESEALRIINSSESNDFSIIYPSHSIKAEPVVAILSCQTTRRNTTEAAHAFISFLFSEEGQQIALRNGLRPGNPSITDPNNPFPSIELWEVDTVFGSWREIWNDHLGPEGSFGYALKIRMLTDGVEE